MIRILVVDNHPIHVQGMFGYLNQLPIIKDVDHCSSYSEIYRQLKENKPNLIFLELNLGTPQRDGFTICQEIVRTHTEVFVAILSKYNSRDCISKARYCGARAYFDKHCDGESIKDFLNNFAQGNIKKYHVNVSKSRNYSLPFDSTDGFEIKQYITRREGEVMQMIVAGTEPKDIQSKLRISYETFRSHHRAILNKLGLKNDVELTRFAIAHNLADSTFISSSEGHSPNT